MREDRRVSSIARRISRAWVWRTFRLMLALDLLILLLIPEGYLYAYRLREGVAAGKLLSFQAAWDAAVPDLWSRIATLKVFFTDAAGKVQTLADPFFMEAARNAFCALLCAEALGLLAGAFFGRRKGRRLLAPLEKMARATQKLTRAAPDPEKLRHLEDAIATVGPTSPDARLQTGETELQGLEEAINDLLRRMNEAYQEQARFVSDASHELRTPIAVIQGYADLLARWGKKDEKVLDESISAIRGESDRMKKLIEQLLFLARGDRGRNQMNPQPMDLAEMMRETCEESRMIYPDREWKLKAPEAVPAVGDADLLKQTARVLIENAVKYTEKGTRITLSAGMEKGVPCFFVQDNGIGMKQEEIPHIFDRFFRSDPARAAGGGTGLGLSIAKWIVEKHGGYFEVLSREGLGTRMTVFLPRKEENKETV